MFCQVSVAHIVLSFTKDVSVVGKQPSNALLLSFGGAYLPSSLIELFQMGRYHAQRGRDFFLRNPRILPSGPFQTDRVLILDVRTVYLGVSPHQGPGP